MAVQPFYYRPPETHNGAVILIGVERDTGTANVDGVDVTLHTIRGYIDDSLEVTETNPTKATSTLYPSIEEKIDAMIDDLKAQIDASDELHELLTDLGFTGGSDMVLNFTVTPGSGQFTLDWNEDPDFEIESIEMATLADDSDAYNVYNGPLTPPIVASGFTTGDTRYYKIRGQRAGANPGPWSYGSATAL